MSEREQRVERQRLVPLGNIFDEQPQKHIVFCHTCNQIVGDHFPIWNHSHDFGSGEMAVKMVLSNQLGFGYYADTEENRKILAEKYRARDEVTVKL